MESPAEESQNRPLAAVIMAAGQGKRMVDDRSPTQDPTLAKVLYPIGGKPMLGHVIALCQAINSLPIVCIVGFGREAVAKYLTTDFPTVRIAIQEEQLGTGHAVQQAERSLKGFSGDVLILSGDVPLLTKETAERLVAEHRERNVVATVLSVTMPDPTGYGRIIRTSSGSLEKIVEEKDSTPAEKKIEEVNSGIYVFDAQVLFEVLKRLDRRNAQGEFYLTDAFGLLIAQFGIGAVAVLHTNDASECRGVNTREQLAAMAEEYGRRQTRA